MSGIDKNRTRNTSISFRVSPEERRQLEARIKASGMPKGTYFIQSLLQQEIYIVVGKYQSDRLSLELRRLREQMEALDTIGGDNDVRLLLEECNAIMSQLCNLMTANDNIKLSRLDFATEK